MRRIYAISTFLLLYSMTPKIGSIDELVSHLISRSNTNHRTQTPHHDHQDDERGCSGAFHICHCHTSTAFLVAIGFPQADVPIKAREWLFFPPKDANDGAYRPGVFRPPIA